MKKSNGPLKSRSAASSSEEVQESGTADYTDGASQARHMLLPGQQNTSERNGEIADIMSAVRRLPEVREARIQEIKERIRSGFYVVDPRRVAESILKNIDRIYLSRPY